MADGTPERTVRLDVGTRLAFERTRVAYERTMMAWVRTAVSLIAFGFSIYKFFEIERSGREGRHLVGPREFALTLIGIGLISLLLAAVEQRLSMRSLRAEYPGMPRSLAGAVAVLIALLGILALGVVLFRD